ncbi:restriction endonuclease subunit S [Leptospira interrogans serovar Bratislava]|nr:restriction endonuclease subunit S [Leptospira interrogans serovar Bratislava]EMN08943.1 type I restriction modification DNA specificity domain protein [Leptospira interrogans serovar Muenchen str. Brem 129]KLO77713.1 Type I restriction modification DNA specificity domain protein [Leptospira interrogans serovar Muenchen]KWV22746.1 hypothetical protein LA733_3057 [Leptospira interrogans]KWV24113.1 hypothetical protein LA702_2986 [Leptospira interrogans]
MRGASPRPIAKFLTDDENSVPWIRIGDTSTSSKYVINTAQKITFEGAKNSRVLKKGDFIMSNSMSFGRPYILQIDGAIHDGWASISDFEDILYPDYLYYFLTSNSVQTYWTNKINSGSVSNLNLDIIKTLPIPIPPLPVQVEIVRILDAFTELTTELTAELASELTARKKQYNYYRDQLLRFEQGEVEWKTLGEVTLPTNNIRWSDTDHSYRYIDLTSVSRENNLITETSKITARNAPSRAQKLVEKDDVIFATTRPTQQRLCLINDEYAGEVASTGYCVLRAKVDEILPKWIYYCISSIEFKIYVQENQSGSAYPAISDAKVKEFKLPIPPLAEQERIVAILDKFDALTNSISEGLPREIRLRQKQYEYYRELLLSFPKAEVGPT